MSSKAPAADAFSHGSLNLQKITQSDRPRNVGAKSPDVYQRLDEAPDADVKTIRLAYLRAAKKWHSDKLQKVRAAKKQRKSARVYAKRIFQRVQDAYDALTHGHVLGSSREVVGSFPPTPSPYL